jgi:DNA-binding NarL/FixJ family response regulator
LQRPHGYTDYPSLDPRDAFAQWIQASKQISDESPKTKILILSAHADAEYVDQLMAIGVSGYLTKQTSSEMFEVKGKEKAEEGDRSARFAEMTRWA